MKKLGLVALGMFAVVATAMAADTATAKPQPMSPAARARADAIMALAKIRAEDARKRLKANLTKKAVRKTRAATRPVTQPEAVTTAPAAAATPAITAQPKPASLKVVSATPVKPAGKKLAAPVALASATIAMTPPAIAVARPPSAASSTPVTGSPRKGIPKGFEDWFAPQKTAVDLYYGGRFLMTTLVEYSMDSITFLNPPEIATRVPGIRSVAEFSILLAAAQSTHSDKVCVRPNQPLCGRLEPATVGVIFDETRFRADLFVHPALLLSIQQQEKQYLPEPSHTHPTLVQNLSALYAGSSEGTNRFSLFGRSRIGLGRDYGFANWVSTDENALSVDELGYTRDMKDIQVTAGLFEPVVDALRAVSRQPIIGASIARSLLTRTDLESVIASPIEIFLPIRGRVDIFRDGRLISTDFYEAGNQSIDTSRLPGGAYNIDIVITDVSGTRRTLQQLFIKSSLMAPPGEPLWFVDAGQVVRRNPLGGFPDDYGTMQLRGGYRWRQKPWLGYGTAAAITGNEGLVELSGGLLFDWIEGSAELYASSAGGTGFGLRGLTRREQLIVSASFQYTQADDPQPPDQYRMLPSDQSLSSINVSHPLWQGLLSGSFNQRNDMAGNSSQRVSVSYTRTLPISGTQSLLVQTEVGEDDGNALAMLTLQWRNTRGKWTDLAQLQTSQNNTSSNADGITAGIGSTWHDGDRFVDDVQVDLRADAGAHNQNVTLEAQHLSQFGRGKVALSTSNMDGLNQTLTALGYDTNIVVGEHGKTTIGGGPNMNESGIILDLGSSSTDALLEVSADGQPQFIARGGRGAAMTLPPYHQYRIRLKDTGLALTQFDDQPREVTLYPGHVVNLDWKIRSVQVLIGRILKADGNAMANARIEGAEGLAFTDNEGYLQTEVSSTIHELVVRHAGGECRVKLPESSGRENVIRAGNLQCSENSTEKPSEPK